jgi:hypothetical protein
MNTAFKEQAWEAVKEAVKRHGRIKSHMGGWTLEADAEGITAMGERLTKAKDMPMEVLGKLLDLAEQMPQKRLNQWLLRASKVEAERRNQDGADVAAPS